MLEKDFVDSIDGKFPYNDLSKGRELIDLSISISDNSVFSVVGELVRIPRGLKNGIDKMLLYKLLEYIGSSFHHALKRSIIDISYSVLNGKEISKNEVIILMDRIAQFNGLYGALNLVYFLADDTDEEIEKNYDKIIQIWNREQ